MKKMIKSKKQINQIVTIVTTVMTVLSVIIYFLITNPTVVYAPVSDSL